MKRGVLVIAFVAAWIGTLLCRSGGAADSERARTPRPRPTATLLSPSTRPRLDLEGQGSIAQAGDCTQENCPGLFSASLSGRPSGLPGSFALSLSVNPNPDPSTGCYPTLGGGAANNLTITFAGELCAASASYELKGSLDAYTTNLCSSNFLAMSGNLLAFGTVHTFGPVPPPPPTPIPVDPIPPPFYPNQAVVSIIGTAGHLPAPCPSP